MNMQSVGGEIGFSSSRRVVDLRDGPSRYVAASPYCTEQDVIAVVSGISKDWVDVVGGGSRSMKLNVPVCAVACNGQWLATICAHGGTHTHLQAKDTHLVLRSLSEVRGAPVKFLRFSFTSRGAQLVVAQDSSVV